MRLGGGLGGRLTRTEKLQRDEAVGGRPEPAPPARGRSNSRERRDRERERDGDRRRGNSRDRDRRERSRSRDREVAGYRGRSRDRDQRDGREGGRDRRDFHPEPQQLQQNRNFGGERNHQPMQSHNSGYNNGDNGRGGNPSFRDDRGNDRGRRERRSRDRR